MESDYSKEKRPRLYIKFFIEPVAALIVGFVFYYPLATPSLAQFVWVLGLFATVSRAITTITIKEEVSKVTTGMDTSKAICAQYFSVDDEDFDELKEEKIMECLHYLNQLKEGTATIGGNEYYTWLNRQMDKCSSAIYAVSAMVETNWISDRRELIFYEHNVKASKRKVEVNRIFVTTPERMEDSTNRQIIIKHINDGLNCFVLYLDSISDYSLKPIAQKGFLILDDRILFEDLEPPSETVGVATKNKSMIRKLMKKYKGLLMQSTSARVFLDHFYEGKIQGYQEQYGDILQLESKIKSEIRTEVQLDLQDTLGQWKQTCSEKKEITGACSATDN